MQNTRVCAEMILMKNTFSKKPILPNMPEVHPLHFNVDRLPPLFMTVYASKPPALAHTYRHSNHRSSSYIYICAAEIFPLAHHYHHYRTARNVVSKHADLHVYVCTCIILYGHLSGLESGWILCGCCLVCPDAQTIGPVVQPTPLVRLNEPLVPLPHHCPALFLPWPAVAVSLVILTTPPLSSTPLSLPPWPATTFVHCSPHP